MRPHLSCNRSLTLKERGTASRHGMADQAIQCRRNRMYEHMHWDVCMQLSNFPCSECSVLHLSFGRRRQKTNVWRGKHLGRRTRGERKRRRMVRKATNPLVSNIYSYTKAGGNRVSRVVQDFSAENFERCRGDGKSSKNKQMRRQNKKTGVERLN